MVPAGSIAYPTADMLLLALLARLLISASVYNTAFHLLASSLVIMLIGTSASPYSPKSTRLPITT